MRATVDTNVLVRMIVSDDEIQKAAAKQLFTEAEVLAIPLQSLTELVWVLMRSYGIARAEVASAIRTIVDVEKVAVDQAAVSDGLACLDAGGDFADGVIAHTGRWLGGETFVSFDAKAVRAMRRLGQPAEQLTG